MSNKTYDEAASGAADEAAASHRSQAQIADNLRLRAAGPSVARVSRKALVIVGGALSAGLAGALFWSLADHPKPPPPEPVAAPAAPPEAITSFPKDYLQRGAPPQLGPPLPGDLGRPFLSAQASSVNSVVDEAAPSSTLTAAPAPAATAPIDPVLAQARAQRVAARASGLFWASAVRPAAPLQAARSEALSLDGTRSPRDDARTTSPERLQEPVSPYILQAGAIIPAVLVTGLRSDAPGLAIAQVTQNVVDSLGGGHLLIPAGSRLVGEYDTTITSGQSRLEVSWTRLILPNGRSIVLDKLPGADAQGMAGLQDGVDRHGARVLASAALSTLLSISAESGSAGDESDLARALRRGTSQAVTDLGQQAVGKALSLAPTLTIRPGAPLRVLLSRDLVLEPYGEPRS